MIRKEQKEDFNTHLNRLITKYKEKIKRKMSKYLELVEGSFTAEHEQRAQEWPYVAYSV